MPRVQRSSSVSPSTGSGGTVTFDQVARAAYDAGFRGQDLIDIVAITKRESGLNPNAYNGNERTGDHSYGLWQINTLGSMGPYIGGILQKLTGSSSFEQLFNPAIAAKVAYQMYEDSGHTLRPWGGYKGQSNTFNVRPEWLAEARAAVERLGNGTALPDAPVDTSAGVAAVAASGGRSSTRRAHSSGGVGSVSSGYSSLTDLLLQQLLMAILNGSDAGVQSSLSSMFPQLSAPQLTQLAAALKLADPALIKAICSNPKLVERLATDPHAAAALQSPEVVKALKNPATTPDAVNALIDRFADSYQAPTGEAPVAIASPLEQVDGSAADPALVASVEAQRSAVINP